MKHFFLRFPSVLCVLCVLVVSPFALAQERVVTAGQDGVEAPKRTRTVNPVYPQEALAQGIRGIVILEVLIDPQGKVTSAQIIRSIAGLDEAALEAVRKWEYAVTKVDGQPVSVKLTVPITFAMKVPEVTRASGIPELRQGALVQYPAGQTEGQTVTAEVTLDPDGQVAEAEVVKGDAPFSIALLTALRTWRFASEGEGVLVSFRVEADFVPARGDKPRVNVRLTGLRRSEAPATAAAASAPAPTPVAPAPAAALSAPPPPSPPAPSPAATTPTPSPVAAAPAVPAPDSPVAPVGAAAPPVAQPPVTPPPAPVAAPPAAPATAAPAGPSTPPSLSAATPPSAPVPASGATTAPVPTAPPAPRTPPTTLPAAGPPTPNPSRPGAPAVAEAKPAPPAPPVEVITAPRPQAEAPRPVEPGVSAIKDVSLALGVPDLVRGRRPVPPPLARMAGTTGTVEVKFGVDASGAASVKEASGPEILTAAATYTVHSWFFRRVTAERLHLVAVFEFSGETAKAEVRPE